MLEALMLPRVPLFGKAVGLAVRSKVDVRSEVSCDTLNLQPAVQAALH